MTASKISLSILASSGSHFKLIHVRLSFFHMNPNIFPLILKQEVLLQKGKPPKFQAWRKSTLLLAPHSFFILAHLEAYWWQRLY
jgi:hypothetical protein